MVGQELEMALKQRQVKFVETRTVIASEVTKFLNSVQSLPEKVRVQVILPNGNTAQEILPALWEEPFDQAAYNSQLEAFNNSVRSVVTVCDALNEEAVKCLRSQ